MHQIDLGVALKLCQDIPMLKERLHRAGLHKTANKMQSAVEEIGYEVASHIEAERDARKAEVTVTHARVWEAFGTTVNRDFFNLMVGDIIGAGEFRIVYAHAHRKDLVLKFEIDSQSFQNVSEWEFWNDNKDDKKVARWLAPVEYISACGIILAMKRTTKPAKANYPRVLPEFLVDRKRQNFGLYKGKLVAHDYGLYHVTVPTQRKKAEWWGDDYKE